MCRKESLRMNVKINVVIFTTDNKERKDVRKLREKKLQIVLDENNNLPTFDINNKEEAKITACNKIIEMFGISKFYIEQLYTWADPKYYDETHEILITYLVIINKNNIQKNVENLSFYDITIEDEDANFQKVILRQKCRVSRNNTNDHDDQDDIQSIVQQQFLPGFIPFETL